MTEKQKQRCGALIAAMSVSYGADDLSQKIQYGDNVFGVKFIITTMAMSLLGILCFDEDDYDGQFAESTKYWKDFAFINSVKCDLGLSRNIPNTATFSMQEGCLWAYERVLIEKLESAQKKETQQRFGLVVGAFARMIGYSAICDAITDPDNDAKASGVEEIINAFVAALTGITVCEGEDGEKAKKWLTSRVNSVSKSRSYILSVSTPDEIAAYYRKRPAAIGVRFMEAIGWDLAEAIDDRM